MKPVGLLVASMAAERFFIHILALTGTLPHSLIWNVKYGCVSYLILVRVQSYFPASLFSGRTNEHFSFVSPSWSGPDGKPTGLRHARSWVRVPPMVQGHYQFQNKYSKPSKPIFSGGVGIPSPKLLKWQSSILLVGWRVPCLWSWV